MLQINQSRRTLFLSLVTLTISILHAYAYYARLGLVLGSRVVLQPELMDRGTELYRQIADEHSPLLSYLLAWLNLPGGDSLLVAKGLLAACVGLTTWLVWAAARRAGGWRAGLAALAFFVLWSPLSFGKLWHDTLLAPIYAGMLLLYPLHAGERTGRRLLGLGLLGGIGVLAKQHALVPLGLLGLWHGFVVWREGAGWRAAGRQVGALALGAAAPIAIFALGYLLEVGSLGPLVFWTLTFSLTNDYASLGVLGPGATDLKILALIGLMVPAALAQAALLARRRDPLYPLLGWGFLLLLGAAATLYPRYAAFHLQSALPVLAWQSGLAAAFLLDLRPRWLAGRALLAGRIALVAALALIWLRFGGQRYGGALGGAPQQIGEYTDLEPVAGEIRQAIGQDACFYLFPETEVVSNLYAILDCAPPDYWVMHYPWFMGPEVKQPALSALEAERPAWIVSFSSAWQLEPLAPEFYDYISASYQPVKEADWRYGSYRIWRRTAP